MITTWKIGIVISVICLAALTAFLLWPKDISFAKLNTEEIQKKLVSAAVFGKNDDIDQAIDWSKKIIESSNSSIDEKAKANFVHGLASMVRDFRLDRDANLVDLSTPDVDFENAYRMDPLYWDACVYESVFILTRYPKSDYPQDPKQLIQKARRKLSETRIELLTARALILLGMDNVARLHLEKVLSLDPANSEAKQLKSQLGSKTEAALQI